MSFRFRTAVVLAAVFAAEPVLAQRPAADPVENAADSGPLAVLVEGDSLDPQAVRAAISAELGVAVAAERARPNDAALVVRDDRHGHFVVTFEREDAPPVVRAITKPGDSSRSPELLALLSGNLVRAEAEALLAELRAKHPPAPSPTEPTVADAAPPAPETPPAAKQEKKKDEPKPKAPETPPKTPEKRKPPLRPINLSLFHPVSLDPDSELHRYRVELGLFYSRIGGLEGGLFNAIYSRIEGDWVGFVANGLVGHAGGEGRGVRMSGIVNVSRGGVAGVDASGIANIDLGSPETRTSALRLSSGLRFAGIYNRTSRGFVGAMGAGIGNYTSGPLDGLSLAGVFDITTERVRGAQATGVVSAAGGPVQGLQVAGVANTAESVEGLQVAGVTNIAHERFEGLQFSVVNIGGSVRGAQIGVANFASELDGFSLGLIAYSGDGRTRATAWADTSMPGNLGVKFSNGPAYTMTHVGYRRADGQDRVAPGLKIGGQLPLEPVFLAIDVGYETELAPNAADAHAEDVVRYRGLVGLDVARPVSIVAGGGVRQRLPTDENVLEHTPHFFAGVELF